MAPVIQIQIQRASGDCAIVALSMYLGIGYEDVFGVASHVMSCAHVHRRGMTTRHMKTTAKRLGTILHLHRSFDIDTACGVLALRTIKTKEGSWLEHAVLLRSGLIFDGDGTVWEPETFLHHYKYRVLSLLSKKDEED